VDKSTKVNKGTHVHYADSDKLKTVLEVSVVNFLINLHELSHIFLIILDPFLTQIVPIPFLERTLY